MANQNNIILIKAVHFDKVMGNQYSITVSDETHEILKKAKENGWKVSPMIDIAVKTLGLDALRRLHSNERALTRYYQGKTYGDEE